MAIFAILQINELNEEAATGKIPANETLKQPFPL
jgi:hypothetical protein